MAILCDTCFGEDIMPERVIYGGLGSRRRAEMDEYEHKVFAHDMSKHPPM